MENLTLIVNLALVALGIINIFISLVQTIRNEPAFEAFVTGVLLVLLSRS